MNAPLTLEAAAVLIEKLGEVDVNTILISVPPPNGTVGPREHHIAVAPGQNFDVMEMTRVLRELGYSLHYIEISGADEPKGFVITPPPPPIEEAEVVVDPVGYGGIWRCTRCGTGNHPSGTACAACGMPRLG